MRTELELLILVRQHIKTYFKTGLCHFLGVLLGKDIINMKEYAILRRIIIKEIKTGRLGRFFRLANYGNFNYGFFWPIGEIKPRIKYLDYLIEKYDRLHKS